MMKATYQEGNEMPISKAKGKLPSEQTPVISAPKEAEKVKEPEAPAQRDAQAYVRYVPPNEAFSERIIRSSDWKNLGINAPDRIWNEANKMQIPEESFSDAELDYLESDGGFEIVDA